ncbi:MAG: hypothetical protein HY901_02365, partial [Deltaproteobacteria bacterium]|nr:hypothetical protein [Deltaproteobacteria bacterium]
MRTWGLLDRLASQLRGGERHLAQLRSALNDRTPAFKQALRGHPHAAQVIRLLKRLVAPPGPAPGEPLYRQQLSEHGLRLAHVFTDHAVLQRGRPSTVWGFADADEPLTVSFAGVEVRALVRQGRWAVELPAQQAGGPHELVVRGARERVVAKDVLVGDVWLCAGQSNMAWRLADSEGSAPDIAAAQIGHLRLLHVPLSRAAAPMADVAAWWERCTSSSAKGFSAVAFYLGRQLERSRGVPIGMVNASWSGSPIEPWIPHEALASRPGLRREILEAWPEQQRVFQEELARWRQECEELAARGEPPARPCPGWDWQPSALFNGMIAPLLPMAIKGIAWYQGESNHERAAQYRELFPALIESWRAGFGQADLPFLAVQIAPWDKDRRRSEAEICAAKPGESALAELREAQLATALSMSGVGLAG